MALNVCFILFRLNASDEYECYGARDRSAVCATLCLPGSVCAVTSADSNVKSVRKRRAWLHLATFRHAFDLSQRGRDGNVGPIWKRVDTFRLISWRIFSSDGRFRVGRGEGEGEVDSPPPGWEYSLQGESSGRL